MTDDLLTTTEQLFNQAREANVRLIRFLYTDNGGIIRGKATHINSLLSRATDGMNLPVAMQAMNMLDQLAYVEEMGLTGEVRLIPDPLTFHLLPYAPGSAAMFADLHTLNGQLWGACPRAFLRRQVKQMAETGFSMQVAFESEWTLAQKRADDTYQPIDVSLGLSSIGMMTAHKVVDDVITALEAQGIPVIHYQPELGFGQQEISIQHTHPLAAADQQVMYRETVRNVAFQHGLYASFAPKPFFNQAGNGAHIHFSLWDSEGGVNLIYDPFGPYNVTPLGMQFIAGILTHLPGLIALTCGSYNSYHRLQPRSWSTAYAAWGPDNRDCAVRVVSRFTSDEEGSANAELKAVDSSGNPYLALGGLIAAGLDGVRRRLAPGQPTPIDPDRYSDMEREQRRIRRLPQTLAEALDELEKDTVLTDALGPLLTKSYLAVKRLEYDTFSKNDESFEIKHHFWKY